NYKTNDSVDKEVDYRYGTNFRVNSFGVGFNYILKKE
ncbi:MAG: hypothetical protein ACI8XB_002691, partial [Patiriisocius sp.]